MSITCLASGTFHQGDTERFPAFSRNTQCVANSACALAWKFFRQEFSSSAIDTILISGDALYRTLRNENSVGEGRLLFPDELPGEFTVGNRHVVVERNEYVHDALYPMAQKDCELALSELSDALQSLMAADSFNTGYLFTGLCVTVGFWRSADQLLVFDPHAVNAERRFDSDSSKNFARLFSCGDYPSLAALLLSNSVCDGQEHQFSVTRLRFRSSDSVTCELTDPKLTSLVPTVVVSPLKNISIPVNNIESKKVYGRPKKVKRGRPKMLKTTRDEQVKQAKIKYSKNHPEQNLKDARKYRDEHPEAHRAATKRYAQEHPEVNRAATKRYAQEHPEVNRAAVERYTQEHPEVHRAASRRYTQEHPEVHRAASQRYSQQHPDVNREAVRQYSQRNPDASSKRIEIFRLKNPKLSELRHLPASLARLCAEHGPMACWGDDLLNKINSFKLKNISLWDEAVYRCPHCSARLFEEEKVRRKWCCGEGSFNVLDLPPLAATFYNDKRFLERSRAYNDLFAFCALEIQGGYRHPSGLSFFKIEGRMYHQVYNLGAPGQKFTTKSGDIQFVNRSRLYIDDGEERRNIAMGRSLNVQITDDVNRFLSNVNPFIENYRRLSLEPSVNAHLDFELTSRATHGPVLGDRQAGIEVHAVLSTEETVNEPRKITIWKTGSDRPTSIDLLIPLMEPFQYPLLYPQGTLG